MNSYEVRAVLAVRVGDHAAQEGDKVRGAAAVRSEEEPGLIIVISV